jgi:SNF2 family DNA or RNA helicase
MIEIKNKKEKALIFTKFIMTQQIIKAFLRNELGIESEILNGTVPIETRNYIVKQFNDGKIDVLIINPRVGGVGLNLIAANHVIHYTPEWNPAVTSQATDRAYRIGQDKDVYVYYFFSKFRNNYNKTIEEYFMKLLERKKQIKNILLDNIITNKEFENLKKEFF